MLKKLMALRANKKGFTLVEVIVVLVIIAILAAILIPTLTGYIDKANEKRVQAEARMLFVAAQTELSDRYATVTKFTAGNIKMPTEPTDDLKGIVEKILALAEMTAADFTDKGTEATITYNESGAITGLTYTSGNYTAVYSGEKGWEITKGKGATS